MQELTENPAIALRAEVEAMLPKGMLRWDQSGKALLISDAPRREGFSDYILKLRNRHFHVTIEKSLLRIDLADDAYTALMRQTFFRQGEWDEDWFPAQALLSGILSRKPTPNGLPDRPLLRAAMLACARGGPTMDAFFAKLRAAAAIALRENATGSVQAAAILLGHWLWTEKGIGLPLPCGHKSGILYDTFF